MHKLYEEVEIAFRKAIELDPEKIRSQIVQGVALAHQVVFKEAKAIFKKLSGWIRITRPHGITSACFTRKC